MPSTRKFYRSVVEIEILSEEPLDLSNMSLSDIDFDITEGDCSGRHVATVTNEEHDGPSAAKLLTAQGSDPGFFMLDAEGNDLTKSE